MKKHNKFIVSIVSKMMVIVLLFTGCVFADGNNSYIYTDENGIEYYVDEDGYTHSYYDPYGNPISVSDAQFMLNNEIQMASGNISGIGNQPNYHIVNDTYLTVNSQTYSLDGPIKVTPDFIGPVSITYAISQTITWTWSVGISAGMRGVAKLLLDLDFNIEIENSIATQTSFSAGYVVPAGKTGAIYFRPRRYNVGMTLHNVNTGTSTTTVCHSPVYLSTGFADGVYELVTY